MTKAIDKQDSAGITTFKPTDKMIEYLDTAVRLLTDSPSKIDRGCSVDRNTWYFWLSTVDGFEEWFYSEYKRRRNRIIPKLDEIGLKYAQKGSFQHWEAMNKKVDDLPDKGSTFSQQFNVDKIEIVRGDE